MAMTHYMELLAVNQPWNLILFMAIPVILAETVAISELQLLASGSRSGPVRSLNRWSGVAAGIYFSGVFIWLMSTAVVPLTTSGGWRGWGDVVAVGFYLAGVVPLAGIALLDLNAIGRRMQPASWRYLHAALVGVFLVVAHVAMIFGMLDPTLAGWTDPAAMPGMAH